jgi:hypothetical protein
MGYAVWRKWGYSDISRGRSEMATEALAEGFDELMWIDADTEFHPEAVKLLRSQQLPIVGGICAIKNEQRLACTTLEADSEIIFGERGGLKELLFVGSGFLFTRREVYDRIRAAFDLPVCIGGKHGLIPFFHPMVIQQPGTGRHQYLSEGYSFCERARQCGFKIMADTRIRLGHIGKKSYFWEEAGSKVVRYKTFRYSIQPMDDSSPNTCQTREGDE